MELCVHSVHAGDEFIDMPSVDWNAPCGLQVRSELRYRGRSALRYEHDENKFKDSPLRTQPGRAHLSLPDPAVSELLKLFRRIVAGEGLFDAVSIQSESPMRAELQPVMYAVAQGKEA